MPKKTLEMLLVERKILLGAIWEQKVLVEILPKAGYDARPFEANVERLRGRAMRVQKQIEDYGAD